MTFELTNEQEALSIFQSFCRIWGSKGKGSLSLATINKAVVLNFEQHLGPLHGLRPGPIGRQGGQEPHHSEINKNQGTSRERRRKKRAAAKASAENVEETEHMSESTPLQKKLEPGKETIIEYKCDMCDFKSSAKNGVSVHKGHKHKDIEIMLNEKHETSLNMSVLSEKRDDTMSQHEDTYLDFTNDQNTSNLNSVYPCPLCKDDHNYCCCGECEECEYLSTEKGLNIHIMNQHEPSDVVTYLGEQWAKDRMSSVFRNPDIANDRRQSAKWDKLYL